MSEQPCERKDSLVSALLGLAGVVMMLVGAAWAWGAAGALFAMGLLAVTTAYDIDRRNGA